MAVVIHVYFASPSAICLAGKLQSLVLSDNYGGSKATIPYAIWIQVEVQLTH